MYDDRRNDFNLSTIIGPNASRCVQRRPVASRRDAYGRILACIWWQWPGFLHLSPQNQWQNLGELFLASRWLQERYLPVEDTGHASMQGKYKKLSGNWLVSWTDAAPRRLRSLLSLFYEIIILFICSEFSLWLINHAIDKSNKNINQITKQSK